MKLTIYLLAMASAGVLMGLVLGSSSSSTAVLAQSETETSQTTSETETQDESTPSTDTYDYVAQSGDSYTKMARKAVQTYGIIDNVSLSEAQIIYCETNLTQAAGSPYLDLGQKVSIRESAIAEWVNKAQNLTSSQEAAWDAYSPYVNFNTDGIGEAS